MRLRDKVAVVVGAGQTPGDTIGNGRATAILFAREGARVLLVDRSRPSALETQSMIRDEGGESAVVEADITREADCRDMARAALETYGRIDVLHNLKGVFLTCKHVLPAMREQGCGSIINVSSIAAVCSVGMLAYKTSKAGLNALTHSLALGNARYGIRVNAIMPGLMNTPMAIESIATARGISKEALIEARDAQVPLGGKMGTAWDVAYAALFLASDEARFITGVLLPVDGGQSARIG
jgi:NAD(P)-dependent dehydrogenase (short-subunit alcohol dehydrogenase family)